MSNICFCLWHRHIFYSYKIRSYLKLFIHICSAKNSWHVYEGPILSNLYYNERLYILWDKKRCSVYRKWDNMLHIFTFKRPPGEHIERKLQKRRTFCKENTRLNEMSCLKANTIRTFDMLILINVRFSKQSA